MWMRKRCAFMPSAQSAVKSSTARGYRWSVGASERLQGAQMARQIQSASRLSITQRQMPPSSLQCSSISAAAAIDGYVMIATTSPAPTELAELALIN